MEGLRQISKRLENLDITSRSKAGQIFIPFHSNRGSWRAGVNRDQQVHKFCNLMLLVDWIQGFDCESLSDVWAV
jgi:hypothetical protein